MSHLQQNVSLLMGAKTVEHRDGQLFIEPTTDGLLLKILPKPGVYTPSREWVTRYPEDLVLQVLSTKGLPYLIDEIRRDEDPTTVERMLRLDILSYTSASQLGAARLLDFGCGSGASSMVLARLFPDAKIVGVELNPKHIETARKRAIHYGVAERVSFLQSPTPKTLPSDLGDFDCILFCAVFEHLLPAERPAVLRLLWDHLRVNGCMFLNDTPYRWFPIETHTTSLPLINYLPDRLAFAAARKLSTRIKASTTDEELLRLGIRGGTTGEVLSLLEGFGATASTLEPSSDGIRDRIDLWAAHSVAVRGKQKTRILSSTFRIWKFLTRAYAVPTLSLAIRKFG